VAGCEGMDGRYIICIVAAIYSFGAIIALVKCKSFPRSDVIVLFIASVVWPIYVVIDVRRHGQRREMPPPKTTELFDDYEPYKWK
jgi:hypothetical protein